MKKLHKRISAVMTILILFQFLSAGIGIVLANSQSSIPRNLAVKETGGKPDISSAYGKPHVVLTWDPASFPVGGDIVDAGYRIYTAENGSVFHLLMEPITSTDTSWDVTKNGDTGLKSGTIYSSTITAFHTHRNPDTQKETVDESGIVYSDAVTFMTDINVEVLTNGTDALEITWDDVRFDGKRIDYEILISRGKDFRSDNTSTFNVRPENVSSLGPVRPVTNERGENLLSFTASGADFGLTSGTVYYVKLKPRINVPANGPRIIYNEGTLVTVGVTNILAAMTKLSDTWWKLWWNPVTDPSLGSNQKINYKIKRGNVSQWDNPILVTIGETTDTKYFIETAGGQYFYVVEADVRDQYGNMKTLVSEKNTPIALDVPVKPVVPDLFEEIRKPIDNPSGEIVYKHDTAPWLTSTSATVEWKVPKLANGTIDNQVVYDIWFSADPSVRDSSTAVSRVRQEYSVPQSDHVDIEGDIVAFKYVFTDLVPNTPYYLKIIAKKKYTIEEDGQLVAKYIESDPVLKAVITPTGGSIDQPVSPAKPPFRIKTVTDLSGVIKQDIGTNNAWVEWSNNWQEIWTGTNWRLPESGEDVNDSIYRNVSYDDKVTFNIGYTLYEDGMDYESIRELPTQMTGLENDMSRAEQLFNIEGLDSNTAYIVWIKARRPDYNDPDRFFESEPSDPVIVVTRPRPGDIPVKPMVPSFTYSRAGDTYVDLQWSYNGSYTYYITYSDSEDAGSGGKEVTVTPTDLLNSGGVIRVNGLTQDTAYYFWIQADSTGQKIEQGLSLKSDSHIVKTLPFSPPGTPKGFGIRNSDVAVGIDSVIFEWLQVEGLEYKLEVSEDITYNKFVEYKAGKAGELTVDKLRSNFRYYVRLYAYDSDTKLYSLPTNSITVRTLRSDIDYDSGEYTEDVVTGPYTETGYSNGVWTIEITGANVDRFIEKVATDNTLDYTLDLTSAPPGASKKVVVVSNRVFRALSRLREYIILDNGYVMYTVRPYVFETEQEERLLARTNDFDIELTLTDLGKSGTKAESGLTYKTKSAYLSVRALNGSQTLPVRRLNKPLKVSLAYTDKYLFSSDKNEVYRYSEQDGSWTRQESSRVFDDMSGTGYASIETFEPGRTAILTMTSLDGEYTDLRNKRQRDAVYNIELKHNLKSIPGNRFMPGAYITVGDGCRIMLDMLDYDYSTDFMEIACKAGFIGVEDIDDISRVLTGKEVINMMDRLCRLKAGSTPPEGNFVVEDEEPVTRGDLIIELYDMLVEIGDI